MTHQTLEKLQKKYQASCEQIQVGALYHHYRNPQLQYQVIALALDEATEEMCVVYKALYGEHLVWVRKLSLWNELVDHNGSLVLRFSRV